VRDNPRPQPIVQAVSLPDNPPSTAYRLSAYAAPCVVYNRKRLANLFVLLVTVASLESC
jgi:hypothetical protein